MVFYFANNPTAKTVKKKLCEQMANDGPIIGGQTTAKKVIVGVDKISKIRQLEDLSILFSQVSSLAWSPGINPFPDSKMLFMEEVNCRATIGSEHVG